MKACPECSQKLLNSAAICECGHILSDSFEPASSQAAVSSSLFDDSIAAESPAKPVKKAAPVSTKDTAAEYCAGCGKIIREKARTCPACGITRDFVVPHGRSKFGAALLAFFLGGLGVHRFYLGQIWLGLVYLLFFWTFIPMFVAFIEGIIFLSTSDVEFSRKYDDA